MMRTGRPAQADIDLDALRHNYRWLRQRHGGRALAVLKADAYGHGAVRCAQALLRGPEPADALAVAFVAEALALRQAGITAPILVLEGAFDATDVRLAHQHRLWMGVHQADQLAQLSALPAGAGLSVWLKLDTGMHRAGFAPAEAHAVWRRLRDCAAVGDLTLMSHLARADECGDVCADAAGEAATAAQVRCFDEATEGLPGPRSLANSAGVLAVPAAHRDWARPGVALYGVDPRPGGDAPLRPVMRLTSRVFALRDVPAGEPVGYGGTWVAQKHSRIGLVALGYADGYPRTVRPGTPVRVDGRLCPLAGRVSMDMMAVDLTDHADLGVGAEVECWGPGLSVNEVAEAAGTIAYELLCGVKRVPMVDTGPTRSTPDHEIRHR